MVGFLVGLGVFWLLTSIVAVALGLFARIDAMSGLGILSTIVSIIYLIALMVGLAVAGG